MLIENKIKINLYRKTSLVRNKKPESLPVRYYVLICFNDMNGCIIFMRRHSQKKKKKWEKVGENTYWEEFLQLSLRKICQNTDVV